MMKPLVALIAAAGTSSRMGAPKALMTYRGQTALRYSVEKFLSLPKIKVYATLPPELIANNKIATGLPFHVLPNFFPDHGFFGSIRSAITVIRDSASGIFITPVDAPVCDRALLSCMAVLACADKNRACIIVPHCGVAPGHPVFLSQHFFGALIAYEGDGGLRGFIAEREENLIALSWPNEEILLNINRREDLVATT